MRPALLLSYVTSSSLYGYGLTGFCGRFVRMAEVCDCFSSKGWLAPPCVQVPSMLARSALILPSNLPADLL